ncbi:hypothetical protein [Alloscardovia theropitheci]|uniref:hypothetical protein n=1 Tax=Alloscardovia theropitheci TaxID=2496842 RepID=UPI0013F15434|nr:hypothetical protein [Alloscardovia theropitheci]
MMTQTNPHNKNKHILTKDSNESIVETQYLMSIPGMEHSLIEALHEPNEDYTDATDIQW